MVQIGHIVEADFLIFEQDNQQLALQGHVLEAIILKRLKLDRILYTMLCILRVNCVGQDRLISVGSFRTLHNLNLFTEDAV